jgi:acetyl esterase/lipase
LSNRGIVSAMHDAKAAVRYFKRFAAIFKIDTNLIFFGGESAGAITALNTTYINQTVEVLFPLTPPFSSNLSIEGNSGNPGYTSKTKAALCFCGGTNFVTGLPLFDTSAINLSTDPPVLFVHGTADPLIPVPYALNVAIRATHLGIPNLFYTFNGATHCPWIFGLPNAPAYLDTLVQYTSSFLYAIVSNYSQLQAIQKTKANFLIYPNPSMDDQVTVLQTKVSALNTSFSVFSATGQHIVTQLQVSAKTELDVSKWRAGIYLIRQNQAPFSSLRFVKE